MLSTKQTTETTFNAITIKEAVVLLPLMDELAQRYNTEANNLITLQDLPEEKKKWSYTSDLRKKTDEVELLKRQLEILRSLGFCASLDL